MIPITRGRHTPHHTVFNCLKVYLESKDLGAETTRESRGPTSGVFRIALDRRPRGFEHRQCRAARGIKSSMNVDELRWKRSDGLRPHLNVRLRNSL
jgi:hypothetical protein